MATLSSKTVASLFIGASIGMSTASAGVLCVPEWQSGYELAGIYGNGGGGLSVGSNGTINTSVVFKGELYVAGGILKAGGTNVPGGVVRWHNGQWEPVGAGFYNVYPSFPGWVYSLAVYNGQLYAGGDFRFLGGGGTSVTGLARWNGTSWEPLPGGGQLRTFDSFIHPIVTSLVENAGTLYIGGTFDTINGTQLANSLAKWNGTTLSAIDPSPGKQLSGEFGTQAEVFRLVSLNNELIVGGSFGSAGGVANTKGIAKWDGTNFVSLNAEATVYAMAAFDDDGAGPHAAKLVAGGIRKIPATPGGTPTVDVGGVCQWDGTSWTQLGTDISPSYITSVGSYDAGSGPKLYASVNQLATSPSYSLRRWNGTTWDAVGGEMGFVNTMTVVDLDGVGPNGPRLFVGGDFLTAGVGANQKPTYNVASFDGTNFYNMPNGKSGLYWTSNTGALLKYVKGDEDGPGPRQTALYAFGTPISFGGVVTLNGVARLDGTHWTSLEGGNGPQTAKAMVFYDDGSGSGTRPFVIDYYGRLYKWTGSTWTYLFGLDISNSDISTGTVSDAIVFDDDGAGPHRPAIYMCGQFWNETGFRPGMIKWDGTTFTPVTSAVAAGHVDPKVINVFGIYNGQLYAGGSLSNVGDPNSNAGSGLARYDGSNWTLVGTNTGNGGVGALAVFQNKLYVGGVWDSIGTATTKGLAVYDGAAWSNVANVTRTVGSILVGAVSALTVADDGAGEGLFIGGDLDAVNGTPMRGITKYNGSTFAALGTGLTYDPVSGDPPTSVRGIVFALGNYGNLVYVYGQFNHAGSTTCFNTSAWGCAASVCAADFNGDNARDVADLFGYINAWLAKNATADFNHDNVVDVADLFGYINAWLAGC